jgi:hypothetical protein
MMGIGTPKSQRQPDRIRRPRLDSRANAECGLRVATNGTENGPGLFMFGTLALGGP